MWMDNVQCSVPREWFISWNLTDYLTDRENLALNRIQTHFHIDSISVRVICKSDTETRVYRSLSSHQEYNRNMSGLRSLLC